MKQHQRLLASLLVVASLSAPGLALANEERTTMGVEDPAPVSAPATAISQAQAIAIAQAMFTIPAELGEPNVGFSQSKEYAVWRIEWRSTDKKAPPRSLNVEVDANTGAIRSYGRWQEPQGSTPLTYTRTEALKLAEEWLQKLGADMLPALRYREQTESNYYWGMSASYVFRWDRLEQGYPVRGQGVEIAIDARTGDLERYSSMSQQQSLTYTLPAEIVTQAQAEAAYRSQLQLQLQYQRFVKPGTDEGRWQLVFRPVTGYYPWVSADGRLVDQRNVPVDFSVYQNLPTVPVPIVPYEKPAKPLTREEALKLAQQVSGRTEEPTSSNYSEYGDQVKERAWDFSWSGSGKQPGAAEWSSNVRINVEAGTVLSYNNWKPGMYDPLKEGEQPKVTLEEARQSALSAMLLFRPDLAGAARLQPTFEDEIYRIKMGGRPGIYDIRFTHLHMGIPVSEGGSTIQIDARTGEVIGFHSYDSRSPKEKLPEALGLIESQKAMAALLKQQPLELVWVSVYDRPLPGVREMMPAEEQGPKTFLVWAPALTNVVGIDAVLGVPLDHAGRDLIEAAKRPDDIEGHWAQREIELLWARGVFELKDGKFHPGQSITVEELAQWLVLSKGMQPYPMYDFRSAFGGAGAAQAAKLESSANVAYFGAAFQSGIFVPEDFPEDLDLNAMATREQFALWAVRAMGYGAIAKMENRIDVDFADRAAIGARYANAVGILQGLGIVKGNGGGAFAPQRLLTRAEAAKILFAITAAPRR